jgi:hypothetical protein
LLVLFPLVFLVLVLRLVVLLLLCLRCLWAVWFWSLGFCPSLFSLRAVCGCWFSRVAGGFAFCCCLPSGCLPPSWSGVSWSPAGGLGSVGCWWLGAAVPVPAQLSLF